MAHWQPLRDLLDGVDREITLSWDDLTQVVGRLPPSAYHYRALWGGERATWKGFRARDVQVGRQVTFERVSGSTGAETEPDHAHASRSEPQTDSEADVVLVSCVKTKTSAPMPAKDLYTSPWFIKARALAQRSGAPWFVLSAQHGLVHPDDVIEPYDRRLKDMTSDSRRDWGRDVVANLVEQIGPLDGKRVEVLASRTYTEPIRGLLARAGAVVMEPLAGLRLGEQLGWLTHHDESSPAVTDRAAESRAGSQPADEHPAEAVIERLLEVEVAMTPSELRGRASTSFAQPGIYSWWVDSAGASELTRGLGHRVLPGLVYVGIAGGGTEAAPRTGTLWTRIVTMHLGGNHQFSTLRLTLGAILAAAWGDDQIDERALTEWMYQHLRVLPVEVDDPRALQSLEADVLAQLDPALNLNQVGKNPLRGRVSELRKQKARRT